MTFLLIHTIAMAIINVISGFFTYKIFKQLSLGANMNSGKLNKVIENEMNPKYNNQELQHFYSMEGKGSVSLGQDSIEKSDIKRNTNSSGQDLLLGIPEDEEEMLNKLLFLSDYLNGKYKPGEHVVEQEFEDMKWETINEVYCLITIGLPRAKAELIRKYFRRLDTTYSKKDGTYYSKVTKGKLAKEIIDDIICAYPWEDGDSSEVQVAPNPENTGPRENEVADAKEKDIILSDINKLTKAVNELKEDIKVLFK